MATIWLLALLSVLAIVSAENLIYPMEKVEDWARPYGMELLLGVPGGGAVEFRCDILPLTRNAGLNQTNDRAREAINIKGNLVSANLTNYNSIDTPDAVAYLSCDNNINESNISPDDMLSELMTRKPELKAILLYSTQGNCCGLRTIDPPFRSIFTMISDGEAKGVLRQNEIVAGGLRAVITGNLTDGAHNTQDNQGGGNSAVAMSILYSITGLITLLFLVIIATGAVRAHRYPERYGPRSGYGGRPRQSRAKGLARAVLETIPIVKFGAPAPAKDDPALELGSQHSVASEDPNTGARLSAISEEPQRSPVKSRGFSTTTEEAAATPAAPGFASDLGDKGDDEHLGCSICTEDFTVGEDVRVLPCDHKFHPACIDPWLINVSGTCPLCRLDLRPPADSEDADTHDDDGTQLPPPLESEVGEPEQPSAQRSARRSSRLLDLHRLRHASVEERIEILRRHRSQQQLRESGPGPSDGSETVERQSHTRLSDRLREKFRIHTRTQRPSRETAGGSR